MAKSSKSCFSSPKVTDVNVTTGHALYDKHHRDRYDYDRQTLIADAIKAYRLNPLVRRIVRIYRQFAIGVNVSVEVEPGAKPGIFAKSKRSAPNNFIQEFWRHPINNMDEQILEWFDERTLTGNLFILFTVDPSGMPLVRAIPTESISAIETADNDYRQEIAYRTGTLDDNSYRAYDPAGTPTPPFVRHYVINRPVGCTFGESDLFPILPWIARYTGWLENRVSLNYYRSMFAWVLSGNFPDETSRAARQKELGTNPPKPNSILVKNVAEEWSIINPELDSYDAMQDGLAVKKNIAVGAGVPLHYLAEPESSTRTTAEAAGTPTFKNFRDYQQSFFNVLRDVLSIACSIRRQVDRNIPADIEFSIHGADISERDNSILSLSANRIIDPLSELYDRKMIDTREFMRLFYSFMGEVYDETNDQPEGLRRPLSNRPKPTPHFPNIKVDENTGEVIDPQSNK